MTLNLVLQNSCCDSVVFFAYSSNKWHYTFLKMETRFHNFSNCIFIFRASDIVDTKIINEKNINKITNAQTIRTPIEVGNKIWRSRSVNTCCFINGTRKGNIKSQDYIGFCV